MEWIEEQTKNIINIDKSVEEMTEPWRQTSRSILRQMITSLRKLRVVAK